MNVNVVGGADEGRFAKVCAARKQGTEGLKVGVVRIVVAAGDICFETGTRLEGCVVKSETEVCRCRPGLDVAVTETAELINKFEIVVPAGFVSPDSRADGVPEFVSCALIEAGILSIQPQIIKVNI